MDLQAIKPNPSRHSAKEYTASLVPEGWCCITVPATHNPSSQPSDGVPVPMSLNVSQVEKATKTKGTEKMLTSFLFIVTRFGGNIPFSINISTLTLIKPYNEAGNN